MAEPWREVHVFEVDDSDDEHRLGTSCKPRVLEEPSRPSSEGLQLHGPAERSKARDGSQRAILHVDCNCFFLAVHMRHDPSLRQAGPLVLWQYNDVICVSPEARAVGVRKHMRPTEAQPLVESIGGRMVHAFSRKWPGPRVWYGPYNQASREVFQWLRGFLDRDLGGGYVLERVSVDEAYIDVTAPVGGSLGKAAKLARRLIPALAEATGIRASVGVAPNRLLAKLASVAAKPPRNGVYAVAVAGCDGPEGGGAGGSEEEAMSGRAEDLLQITAASKLPGLGGRATQLEASGLRLASDLWELPAPELQARLGLSNEAAAKLVELCQGRDTTPVQPGDPKKSLAATSWLTDAVVGDLALKTHAGRGGEAITVGSGWVFEPHNDRRVSNSTRARWILLALVLDLEEKTVEEFLEFGQLPTKLTISYQGPGTRKEPGLSGFTDGHTHSRTVPFPTAAFNGLRSEDSRAAAVAAAVPQPPPPQEAPPTPGQPPAPSMPAALPAQPPRVHKHSVYGTEFLAPVASPAAPGLPDGPEALAVPRYRARVAALVDACASLLSTWSRELPSGAPVAQLTLTARGMEALPGQGSAAAARRCEASGQRTLAEVFARKRARIGPAPVALAIAPCELQQGPPASASSATGRCAQGASQKAQESSIWDIPAFEVSDGE